MRGRKPHSMPRERKVLRLRADLSAQVDLLLLNPTTGKAAMGQWNFLVETLLQRWLKDRTQGSAGTPTFDVYKARVALGLLQGGNIGDLGAAIKLLEEALGAPAEVKP